jgi:hypothetical protein
MAADKKIIGSIISGILSVALVIGIILGANWLIELGVGNDWGVSQNYATNIGYSGTFWQGTESVLTFFIGDLAGTTQGLLLAIGFFMIMLFAISDILRVTSTFTPAASWGIATGLALIMAGAGVVEGFYDFLLQGAAITAFSIFVVILALIAIFLVAHLLWGSLIIKAQIDKKVDKIDGAMRVQGAKIRGDIIAANEAVEANDEN